MTGSTAGSTETPEGFSEPGARWRSVAWGPAFALLGVVVEVVTGATVHLLAWLATAVLLGGLTALQVRAARTHTSVVVGSTTLRQGEEELPLAAVAHVHGPSTRTALDDPWAPWETAPALGGPSVPRKRTGVGLELRDGRTVQAWARDDDTLRAVLRARTTA